MTEPSAEDPLARAKGYPYYTPPYSYLFVNGVDYQIAGFVEDPILAGALRVDGEIKPVAEVLHGVGVPGAAALDERVPVIAHGSNAAPTQLVRKFARVYGEAGEDVVIPVLRARLVDFDVVYAAHFSGYGAIPATLEVSPGTTAEIAVTWLTPPQLALMHDTEITAVNYVYGRLGAIQLEVDGLEQLDAAFVYLTLHGSVTLSGEPMALAAVKALRRRFKAASVPAMLAMARDRVAPDTPLDAFIMGNIEDDALRQARTATLRQSARRPTFDNFEVLAG